MKEFAPVQYPAATMSSSLEVVRIVTGIFSNLLLERIFLRASIPDTFDIFR
jgi:hypothetical protein